MAMRVYAKLQVAMSLCMHTYFKCYHWLQINKDMSMYIYYNFIMHCTRDLSAATPTRITPVIYTMSFAT